MTKHSAIVGGSTAGRLLECPGSYQATIALPPSADIPSEYAEEGTAMHAVMDRLMRLRRDNSGGDLRDHIREMIGAKFYDRQLTLEYINTLIDPALDALDELEQHYDGGPPLSGGTPFHVLGVEVRVAFPGIPGAFGTIDLLLGNASWILHIDWKFGGGVFVPAVYADDKGERVNPQLMFYTAASMASHKGFYAGKRGLVVATIQPRAETPLSHVVISRKEVKWFVEDMHKAVTTALGYQPPRAKGEWCRFAPCKVNCPLWTGPLLDLSALQLHPRTEPISYSVSPASHSAYAEYLARAKALVDILALYKKEVDEQLHAYLEDGGTVPGWRLKAKVKQRQWIDEETVRIELEGLGFDTSEIYNYKLVTFQQADATARKLKVKIPGHLRVAPPSNETTIATTDDPAPVIERSLVIEQFQASLKQLTGS